MLTSDLSPPELVSGQIFCMNLTPLSGVTQRLGDNEICVRIGMVYRASHGCYIQHESYQLFRVQEEVGLLERKVHQLVDPDDLGVNVVQ